MSRFDYDVVVIGGGAAGLTASGLSAALGARTLLVERERTGGECTWSGCVPSKALITAARFAQQARAADAFGISVADVSVDFPNVMERIDRLRQTIYEEVDAPERLALHNVEVAAATASFVDPHTLQLDGGEIRRVTSRYVILCTGSRPRLPLLPGIDPATILTNETIFSLRELPSRLLVVGGGPVGVELAQAFGRLGSSVTLVTREERILEREEPEAAALVAERLEGEGVRVVVGSTVEGVEEDARGRSASIASGERWQSVRFDRLFAAVGRTANVEALRLENAGVVVDEEGVRINASCQTNVDHIYACGDVTNGPRFTHVAENMARTAVTRLLLKTPASYETDALSHVIFTDPELAHLGATAAELSAASTRFETITFPFERIDRALIEGRGRGTIMIHYAPSSGRLLGAHIVGERAGELIHELALAMKHRLGLKEIADTVHAYPTYAQGLRRAADQWYVRHSPVRLLGVVKRLFGYRGQRSEALGRDDVV